MNAVEFKNVYFRYGPDSRTILRDVSFALEWGKVVLLTGYSGSGKSTLMSLINGAIPNYVSGEFSGEILVAGESVYGRSIAQLSCVVGSVLQNADSQIVHDIVEDEIAFGAENLGVAPELITESVTLAAQQMKLDPRAMTRKLSGGQKQRLITASTLAMKQKIILLDEPLANLDKEGADIILTKLRELAHDQGYLVFIVEHRIDYILDYVDEIYAFENAVPVQKTKNQIKAMEKPVVPYMGSRALDQVVLSAENINVSFGSRNVLRDISLDVKKGEKILLRGENGCGKTTLTKVLSRLIKPTSGSVQSIYGSKGNKGWFRHVGYVYQNPDYQLFMPTVEKEIDYACASQELKEYVIDRLELEPLLERHPFSLSQGQKRKVTVAAIACMKPDILFLDEPTVGQDDASLVKMIDVLLHLNQEYGTSLISVTHDNRCGALGDRTIFL